MFDTLTLAQLPPEDEALRPAIRAFIDQHIASIPMDRRARSWQGFSAEFSRALGQAGFLGLTLPKEYGGHGKGPFARFVVVEELLSAGAPVAAHWIADRQSAPLLLNFGTEAQRRKHIPAICRGEQLFCIGMSEPGSGSDLASVRTRAELTGGGWVVNGQKIWTTNAMHSDYMIALIRTSGTSADRQGGLSQLIIDLKAPGVTVRPIVDLTGDAHFAEVFFENVELGDDALVGQEGEGWKQVVAELAFERSGPERIYSSAVLLDAWIKHVQAVGRKDCEALVGRLTAELATLRAMSIACTARLVAGESPVVEASIVKDRGTGFEQELPVVIADDLAAHPDEAVSEELYRTLLYVTHIAPSFSLRGGTREILRGIIARGMGLR
ncbi:acyl-CoA dehydrogenase family protein [Novosphingobium taihuense]|uniref:Alkylation response protein AidB-like acyl-CoA dehydrogenase n=1 Tax=Novosphingobium taihuense TaxID=260085 RepID=A0A7W7ABH2_9SPHN|nr:acyl-CoA dehydrogenase family protein [Novosphingobium taihuense]MBB4613943.1 alkylation response protein AidB-like acyl-CoA dehydrogenase [Novosphingobium taihuense]TWH86794.1 alkylation response protein AidB-like acyl-CoA dehydrogenase [Novosphingobium taihuense]